jgi:hypothetical protein
MGIDKKISPAKKPGARNCIESDIISRGEFNQKID